MTPDMREVLEVAFRVLLDRIEDLTEESVQAKAELAEAESDSVVLRGLTGEPVAHRQVLEELRLPDPRYEMKMFPPCSTCGEPVRMDGSCGCGEPAEEVAHLEHSLKETEQRLMDAEARLTASQQRCRDLEARLVKGGCDCRPGVTVSRMPCPECSSPMTFREPGGWSCDACEHVPEDPPPVYGSDIDVLSGASDEVAP